VQFQNHILTYITLTSYPSFVFASFSPFVSIPLEQDNNLGLFNSHVQGVDPDAPEEDEDNEADDIDADQDDAELL
jgi:hypothetical protein